jgi:hypothetical protein
VCLAKPPYASCIHTTDKSLVNLARVPAHLMTRMINSICVHPKVVPDFEGNQRIIIPICSISPDVCLAKPPYTSCIHTTDKPLVNLAQVSAHLMTRMSNSIMDGEKILTFCTHIDIVLISFWHSNHCRWWASWVCHRSVFVQV